jgi:restriction system protein
MSEKTIWMVRAGRGGAYVDDFIESNFVGIGFASAGEVASPVNKDNVIAKMREENPAGKFQMAASQILRFYDDFQIGDSVMTYDPGQRLYFIGVIKSDVKKVDHILFRARDVEWKGQVARDSLVQSTRNSLGAISTIFMVRDEAAEDVVANTMEIGTDVTPAPAVVVDDTGSESDVFESIEEKANELLEDMIAKLDWEQMQELVAEILQAMDFKTDVSPRGPDRGIDVFASPDGLGLLEPRIFVEVKHRLGARMGADQIRTFLGGRQPGDRCLYVSTGGFSKEAKYEAERANVPLKLIDLPKLRELVLEHYESFSPSGLALLPLKKLLWPA